VTVELRSELRTDDREAVGRLVRESGFFSEAERGVALELVDARRERGPASGYEFLVAEEQGAVRGYACFGPIDGTDGRWDLYWIVVEAARRGQGIGRLLLEGVEHAVAASSGRRIYVDTSSRTRYRPTRAFYRSAGYREAARIEDFYRRGDGKVIFVKVLTEDPSSSRTGALD
jgi:ribosomal protein S18 acetylase RimI-like enzyme